MTAPQRGKKSLPFILPSFGAVVVVVGVVVFEIDPTFVWGGWATIHVRRHWVSLDLFISRVSMACI